MLNINILSEYVLVIVVDKMSCILNGFECFQPIYEMQTMKPPATSEPIGRDVIGAGEYTQPVMRNKPGSAAAQSSAALSSNLSELDNLLQELSSAQFAVEVDRRSAGS